MGVLSAVVEDGEAAAATPFIQIQLVRDENKRARWIDLLVQIHS